MKLFLALFLGILIGAGAIWLLSSSRGQREARQAGEQIEHTAKSGYEAVQEQVKQWDLRPQDIKEELASGTQIVRKKAQQAGQAVADATADARITTTIKGKFLSDRSVPAMAISVNTTEGVVTLSGSVSSADEVSRAMTLAMEVEGVREVISTMQVKGSPPVVTRRAATNAPNPSVNTSTN